MLDWYDPSTSEESKATAGDAGQIATDVLACVTQRGGYPHSSYTQARENPLSTIRYNGNFMA
ncbi:hypothetical protein ACHZ98_32265 [Streptomyces sp. MAR4 CNY-716]